MMLRAPSRVENMIGWGFLTIFNLLFSLEDGHPVGFSKIVAIFCFLTFSYHWLLERRPVSEDKDTQ